MRSRTLALVLASILPLAALSSGCDAIADIAGAPDEVDVSAGSAGRLTITPDAVTVTNSDVNVGRDLPNLFDVDDLDLPEGSVTFTPSTAGRGMGINEICPFNLSIFVNGVRAANGQVTADIQGSTATVTQASVQFATGYNAADLCGAFPGGNCPASSGTYTGDQIRDAVTEAIQSGQFGLSFTASNPSPTCAGVLAIQTLRFGLDY